MRARAAATAPGFPPTKTTVAIPACSHAGRALGAVIHGQRASAGRVIGTAFSAAELKRWDEVVDKAGLKGK